MSKFFPNFQIFSQISNFFHIISKFPKLTPPNILQWMRWEGHFLPQGILSLTVSSGEIWACGRQTVQGHRFRISCIAYLELQLEKQRSFTPSFDGNLSGNESRNSIWCHGSNPKQTMCSRQCGVEIVCSPLYYSTFISSYRWAETNFFTDLNIVKLVYIGQLMDYW